jgi:3-dehydroquinate dehydratase
MALKDIFKDSNDINEQSVAAFIAIGLVAMITISIIISNILCRELIIQEFIFISLLTFAAAALGIAGYKTINSDGKGK